VNENETQPAYFDDFEIRHKPNPQKLTVSSWAEYYAFGKVAKASCSGAGAYRYGYQGEFAEKEEEWNSFELRQYDSEVAMNKKNNFLKVNTFGKLFFLVHLPFNSYFESLAYSNLQSYARIDRQTPLAREQ
jgi:hypothetical protein